MSMLHQGGKLNIHNRKSLSKHRTPPILQATRSAFVDPLYFVVRDLRNIWPKIPHLLLNLEGPRCYQCRRWLFPKYFFCWHYRGHNKEYIFLLISQPALNTFHPHKQMLLNRHSCTILLHFFFLKSEQHCQEFHMHPWLFDSDDWLET